MKNFLSHRLQKHPGGFLVLLAMCLWSFVSYSQTTVSGTVMEGDTPLPGLTVLVKGTKQGTTTDFDGNYTINNVPANATLIFSYVGFITQEVPVNGKTTINITMVPDTQTLEEIVVVGYGTQRKEAVTGSVVSLGAAELQEVPSPNASVALQGRLPGVELSSSNTKPGAPMQIRIRGVRSISGNNDPLVVLDGIPFVGSISEINPNDIKSMDILKDASATAIYGSRGANGVILITTKKGVKGQEARISYNGYTGVKTLFARYDMMNSSELAALRDANNIIQTDGLDEDRSVNFDWQDNFYQPGILMSHDVSVNGGTEKGAYNFGLGYYKEEAVIPIQDFERISLRGAVDQEVGNFITLGFNTKMNYSVNNGNSVGLYNTLSASPMITPYDADGNLRRTINMPLDESWNPAREHYESLGDAYKDQSITFAAYNSIYGEVKIPWVKGLKYRVNVGLDYRTTKGGYYRGQGVFSNSETADSYASISNSTTKHWLIENLITYDRTFAEKHQVNFVALYSNEYSEYQRSAANVFKVPADFLQYYNLGQSDEAVTVDPGQQQYNEQGLTSYMARLMYSFDNKYFITGTLRSDASSRLAPGHQWFTYPAVSAGWNMKNEKFLENVSWLNQLKLRAGYGKTSNQAIDPYSTLGLLGTRPYNFGDTNTLGYYVTQIPNPSLGWEFSTTYNYGVDFGLFNGRLSGTFEYYTTKTEDILYDLALPQTSGVSNIKSNIGSMENKGFEISLNGIILDNPDGFTWDVGVNLYVNKNELTSLASGETQNVGSSLFVGSPLNVIYDYQYEGLWQEGDPYMDILQPGATPGTIKVKYTGEYNADGTPVRAINADDRQIIDTNPDFQGGFNTRVGYKNFDLSVVGVFKSGGTLISTLYGSAGYLNMLNGRRNNVRVDYWTEENTGAKYPAPDSQKSGDNPIYGSTLGYFDASFLKIRTISLGYNFTQTFFKDLGIDNFRMYATVQNPFVFFSPYHKESGMDPETNSYGDENQAVSGYSRRLLVIGTNTPSTTNYLLGVNLTF